MTSLTTFRLSGSFLGKTESVIAILMPMTRLSYVDLWDAIMRAGDDSLAGRQLAFLLRENYGVTLESAELLSLEVSGFVRGLVRGELSVVRGIPASVQLQSIAHLKTICGCLPVFRPAI